jgi:phage baseplate assembly protein W
MPIPQIVRVNPLDLQENIAIGVSLPFNGPAGPFNKTYSTQDQIKSNLIHLLLTDKGERVFNPEFGMDLKKVLFEGITDDTETIIKDLIVTNTNYFIPGVQIQNILVNSDIDRNSISVTVNYSLPISGKSDQITVQFI